MPPARRTFNQEVNGPLLKTAPGENVFLTCCADRRPNTWKICVGDERSFYVPFFLYFFSWTLEVQGREEISVFPLHVTCEVEKMALSDFKRPRRVTFSWGKLWWLIESISKNETIINMYNSTIFERQLLAFLFRIRREEQYHSHVCRSTE